MILFLNLLFVTSLYSTNHKAKDYYIKILIYNGKNLTTKKNKVSVTLKKIVYQHQVFRYKNNKSIFVVKKSKPIIVYGNKYYGQMIVVKGKNKIWLINQIPLETYLIGVVDKEISYSWPIEAIKAQVVAARTYAVYHMVKNKKEKYHIGNTTAHQVFSGIENVNTKIIDAIKKTRGTILTYNNQPIITFFHASCGGHTEEPKNVWNNKEGESFPYLKSIKCNYCTSHPRYSWDYSISAKKFQDKLDKFTHKQKIINMKIKKKSKSQRVIKIQLLTKNQKITVNGNDFRMAISPKKLSSTKFSFQQKKNKIIFHGSGFGHGVGMCQWGAKTRAERGDSYIKILKFYYNDVKFKKII